MDFEEIEGEYSTSMENADKEFLEKLKNKEDKKKAEKAYTEVFRKAHSRYYDKFTKKLKNPPKKKEKKKKKEAPNKHLDVGDTDLGPTFYERTKMNLEHKWFTFRFKIRNFRRNNTPDWMLMMFIKFKLHFKRFRIATRNNYDSFKNSISEFFSKVKKGISALMKKVYTKLIELPEKIFDKFTKKKGGDKKEEGKKEDEDKKEEK